MAQSEESTDEALMLAYAGGDAASFEALFQRHRRPLFTFLLHNLGDRAAAEDLFQEIFLRLVRGRVGYRPTGSFRSWLFRIAHNALTDHRRRTGLRESQDEETTMTTANDEQVDRFASLPSKELGADPVSRSQDKELRERIEAALLRIPEEQREVFLLRERGGLEFQHIAELTGHPLATVKSRMRYALANLRQRLSESLPSLSECLHE